MNLSIKQKVYALFFLLLLVAVISGWHILDLLHKASNDSTITKDLGRQRMLTQAMGKSALAYSMAKSQLRTVVGKAELQASLDEYEMARNIFGKTLAAAKSGGEYPEDLDMTRFNTISAIDNPAIQQKLGEVEIKFKEVTDTVSALLSAEVNSDPYRKSQQAISILVNELRALSNEVVQQYNARAGRNQGNIRSTVVVSSLLILLFLLGIATYLTLAFIRPIVKVSGVIKEIEGGNLKQEKLPVSSGDEVGILSQSANHLLDGLRSFILHSQEILKGDTERRQVVAKGDFKASLEEMLRQAEAKVEIEKGMALREAFTESSPNNIMWADARNEFRVQYLNSSSLKLLATLETHLPCHADEVLGKPIDIFHKNPEMQRKLLSNPNNLPHQAKVQLGPEILQLDIISIVDKDGNYLGPMITWAVITEWEETERKAKDAEEKERLREEDQQMKARHIQEVVAAASLGDLTQRIAIEGTDVMGSIGESLKKFMLGLRRDISEIAGMAQNLASASEGLTTVSQQMVGNAEETAAQSGVVSSAAEQVSQSVQTIATGAEEMSASVKEIAKNANEAAKVASEAVRVAQNTNIIISKLGSSSNEIGQVIKIISTIAEQTNLLALNATIEAARAGESGKGFAVVANEVKELARQTSDATGDIGKKIEAIQTDTSEAVKAIEEISGVINQINDIANTIASAVEEQSATTNEMSRNVSEAAKGGSEIARNIQGVAEAAQSTTGGATETQSSAQELSHIARKLGDVVTKFKYADADA